MITLESQRVLWNRQGTLTDYSTVLNDFRNETVIFDYTAGDYLYIGTWFPFNHRHFELETPNVTTPNIVVQYWNGDDWQDAVDVIDRTIDFSRSNTIRFATDDDEQTWAREDDTKEDIPELATVRIYDKFWLRISWDADLDASTELKYIGWKFSDDDELYGRYPDLNNQMFRNAFEPSLPQNSKLDWNEQHFMASEEIISDLKRRNLVYTGNQILDYEILSRASVHKVAEMIYGSLGEAYNENRSRARDYYNEALNTGIVPVDKDMNANLDDFERVNMSGKMSR